MPRSYSSSILSSTSELSSISLSSVPSCTSSAGDNQLHKQREHGNSHVANRSFSSAATKEGFNLDFLNLDLDLKSKNVPIISTNSRTSSSGDVRAALSLATLQCEEDEDADVVDLLSNKLSKGGEFRVQPKFRSFFPSASPPTPDILKHRSISLATGVDTKLSYEKSEGTVRDFQPFVKKDGRKTGVKADEHHHECCAKCTECTGKKIQTLLWDVGEYIDSPVALLTSEPVCKVKQSIERALQRLGGEFVEDSEYSLCYRYQVVRQCKNLRFNVSVSRLQYSCMVKHGHSLLIEFSKERSALCNLDIAEVASEFFSSLSLGAIARRKQKAERIPLLNLKMQNNVNNINNFIKVGQKQSKSKLSEVESKNNNRNRKSCNELFLTGRDCLSSFVDLLYPSRCTNNCNTLGLAEIYADESHRVITNHQTQASDNNSNANIKQNRAESTSKNTRLREGDVEKLKSLFWKGDVDISRCTCTVLQNIAKKGWLKTCSVLEKKSLVKEIVRLVHVMQGVDFSLELRREALKCFVELQESGIVDCEDKTFGHSHDSDGSSDRTMASLTAAMLKQAAESNDQTVSSYARKGMKLAQKEKLQASGEVPIIK